MYIMQVKIFPIRSSDPAKLEKEVNSFLSKIQFHDIEQIDCFEDAMVIVYSKENHA